MQAASKTNLQAHALNGGNTLPYSPVYRWSRPEHAVSAGLVTMAEDKRPKATLIIGLSEYASQRHTHLMIRG